MNRKLVGGAVALVVVVAGVWLLWFRDRGDDSGTTATGSGRRADVKLDVGQATPERAPSRGFAPKWSLDADPEGPLRLEGQVVDGDGHGVDGAEVWLASVPPRSAKTEGDGTFVFDKLVGRTYAVSAKHGDLVGGPMSFKLTEHSDPVVIRLGAGATVIATVVDEAAKPIADADVKVAGTSEHGVKSDAQGKATLRPVHPGWVAVEATASGYAPAASYTTVGSPGAIGELKITLRKGAAVSGRVVDAKGAPIAKVRVTAGNGFWDTNNDATTSTTDDKGQFSFAALAPGNHTLSAIDGEHAPSRSTPIAVTADRPVTGIEIVMAEGGVFSGIVVDRAGTPKPYATVRVAGSGPRMWNTASRQATTDKTGKFELRGLVRAKLQARAESDTAASKVVAVDLSAKAKVEDKLVLDVEGSISGNVVDDAGRPVPEIEVNAFPDILGGANTESLVLAGMSSTTTDGAGAFTIHGVPDGAYRLWASRGGGNSRNWGRQGTPAKAGDKDVKIVLPATGSLVGKVAIAGSSTPPKLVLVVVGTHTPTPSPNGVVSVEELEPGNYDVTFRGAEFAELTKHDVKIEPGKATDLGTVTVNVGRRLVGKVVDSTGAPVASAKVKLGEMLFGIAGQEDRMENFEDMAGIRASVTDADGDFTIIGIPAKATNVMADHPDRGRSLAMPVPAGTDDPPAMTIPLRGFGSIIGKVTMQGQPQPGVSISESAKGGGAQATFAQTADDGSFTLPKVQEGTHVLNAMRTQMMAMKSTSVTVDVVAGKQSTVTIDIPVGTITLDVAIKPAAGATVNAAQVWLFTGVVQPTNAKQLVDGLFQGGIQGMKVWLGPAFPPPEFDELVPADYSACVVPVTGDFGSPQFQQRLRANMQLLKVYCKLVHVAPSPQKQTVTSEVPSMVQLPASPQ